MTPKEFDFLFGLITVVAREAYQRGGDDMRVGNILKNNDFRLSPAQRLVIKTNLKKYVEKR